MLYSTVVVGAALVASAVAASTDAPVVTNNPVSAQYRAAFVPTAKNTMAGEVVISSIPSGKGVNVQVTMTGFPGEKEVTDYLYHIHTNPVPADGNCTATLAHLDPFSRGEDPPCDSTNPASCQVGDLSGKHGKVPAGRTGFSDLYQDLYISTDPNSNASVFGRSIVFHFPNKTRIACANLTQLSAGFPQSTASASGSAASASSGSGSASAPSSVAGSASTASGLGSLGSSNSTAASTGGFPTQSVQPYLGAADQLVPRGPMATLALVLGAAVAFALF
ncbi:Cu,Zn superoxide dismutase-like protein [Myriangium duriaei CBS 260.36]|uniref:superoxide dismutase n=1 Tax=Myriangium duriaei CBS 260.36 TaxID=1168546 RepID=A0A9P4J2U2_9PEZI|nr:Cu,Zn superoxide dismutase-like protein [Myriangium duriaei CBS 260.36]